MHEKEKNKRYRKTNNNKYEKCEYHIAIRHIFNLNLIHKFLYFSSVTVAG